MHAVTFDANNCGQTAAGNGITKQRQGNAICLLRQFGEKYWLAAIHKLQTDRPTQHRIISSTASTVG